MSWTSQAGHGCELLREAVALNTVQLYSRPSAWASYCDDHSELAGGGVIVNWRAQINAITL